MDHLKSLFQYLDAETISIDKEEFEFQFNSHPDYPSLLAMGDTLRFFNISNGAFKVDRNDIELLPDYFMTRLKKEKADWLSFVEKTQHSYFYTNGTKEKHRVDLSNFKEVWNDVVFLVEKDATEVATSKPAKHSSKLLLILSSLLLFTLVVLSSPTIWYWLFAIFPLIGIYLSMAALKDLFKTKNTFVDKFCNSNPATSCSSVVNSDKWTIFKTISFSDLSIVFFATQLVALFLMGLSNYYSDHVAIQSILLFASVPILLASLYYQKYVEKKWCPICLTIVGVILLELVYALVFLKIFNFNLTLYGALLFLFVALSIVISWFALKTFLKERNELKAFELKANRFKRNYGIFKKMLLSSNRYTLPESLIQFGNPDASLHISIVTSPYCGHCKAPHYILKSLLGKYGDQISVSLLHNVTSKIQRMHQFVTTVINLKLSKGEQAYNKAMDFWYENKDNEKWFEKYKIDKKTENIEAILAKNQEWFTDHNINFTPCLFVNGYQYPREYDIKELPFFIDELMDDQSFYKKKQLKL